MKETTITTWCDACHAAGKRTKLDEDSTVIVDLGAGPYSLDLCKADRKRFIDPLLAMIDEFGVPGEDEEPRRRTVQRLRDTETHACPKCSAAIRGARINVLKHLESLHGMSSVEASKAVPPANGQRVPCPVCGYITAGGTGMAGHVVPAHGRDVWAKLKAERSG